MMRKRDLVLVTVLLGLVGCTASPGPTPSPIPPATAAIGPVSTLGPPAADLVDLLSRDSLLAYIEDLTAIQPYSGWRNSASLGEQEALDYVEESLGEFAYLRELGLESERQSFRVFLGTELWESRLILQVDGQEIEVPADGLRGHRDDVTLALRFDSDGALNDTERDPVVVEGPVVLVRSPSEVEALDAGDVAGKVVFLDYATIDWRLALGAEQAVRRAIGVLHGGPIGLVVVTRFSNEPGESHGTSLSGGSPLEWVESQPAPPTLYVRLEDLAPAGIQEWDDLARIETARLTWDADVSSPATSGNLIARIPGADPSRAVILGAHVDSPNNPGAMDDGSGSAILLEVARVLDAGRVQPASDLYLAWFGSEELGAYGSSHFVATHQELLDRTLAMLSVDCLTRPLHGIDAGLRLITWSYGRLGDERLAWPDYLAQAAAAHGVEIEPANSYAHVSDNGGFVGFDVPNANLIHENEREMDRVGGVHYAGHIHDPYDTVELAREMGETLEEMARVTLVAALTTGNDAPSLRVTPPPDHRALFVASHTEAVYMAPTRFTEMGMALAMEKFDVDMVPYGEPVTPAHLQDADMVVVLPVLDYPAAGGDPDQYDEAWTEVEIAALERYVAQGGLLVLTNSASRLKYGNQGLEPNEDWEDVNALATRFGVTYQGGLLAGRQAWVEKEGPLMGEVWALDLAENNGVRFSLSDGEVLAWLDREPVVALVGYGDAGGEVLVLADVGLLVADWGASYNLAFWQSLARHARQR